MLVLFTLLPLALAAPAPQSFENFPHVNKRSDRSMEV